MEEPMKTVGNGNAGGPLRIGVDVGGSKMEGIVLTPAGDVAEVTRRPTPPDSYAEVLEALAGLIANLQQGRRLTVGIGTPGALTPGRETIKNSNSTCFNGKPLKRDIEQKLGYSVKLENDANCFALSEAHYGAGKDYRSVFGVIIGTGTGGGIVIDGKLHTGPNRIAGEWGHNCVPASLRPSLGADRTCYCGRLNCIETVLCGAGLKRSFVEAGGAAVEAAEIARLARAGDRQALVCIDNYCRQIAQCLATIINVLDPEIVVFGGGLSNIEQIYQLVPRMLGDHVFTDEVRTRISPPRFGDASGARGAACLWSLTEATEATA